MGLGQGGKHERKEVAPAGAGLPLAWVSGPTWTCPAHTCPLPGDAVSVPGGAAWEGSTLQAIRMPLSVSTATETHLRVPLVLRRDSPVQSPGGTGPEPSASRMSELLFMKKFPCLESFLHAC